MRTASHTARFVSLMLVLVLGAGACSSSDGADSADEGDAAATPDATEAAGETESPAEDESGSTDTGVECEAAERANFLLRGSNGWIGQVVDAESEELVAGDYEAVLAAVDTLRPAQDIEGLFGAMRPGLDNIEADITALQEGRFADKVGEYGLVAMGAVVAEEICA